MVLEILDKSKVRSTKGNVGSDKHRHDFEYRSWQSGGSMGGRTIGENSSNEYYSSSKWQVRVGLGDVKKGAGEFRYDCAGDDKHGGDDGGTNDSRDHSAQVVRRECKKNVGIAGSKSSGNAKK